MNNSHASKAVVALTKNKVNRIFGSGAAKIAVIKSGDLSPIVPYLVKKSCSARIFSLKTPVADIEQWVPKGFILAGDETGGDPQEFFSYLRPLLKYMKSSGLPVFGIGLGHQLLAISEGLNITVKQEKSYKRLPVKNRLTGKIEIKKSNDGAYLDLRPEDKSRINVTHMSINEQHAEGVQYKRFPGFSVQYRPETSDYLLNHFIDLVKMRVFKNRTARYSSQQSTWSKGTELLRRRSG